MIDQSTSVPSSGIHLTQSIGLRGDLKISLVYPEKTEVHFEAKNLIVLAAKVGILNRLCTAGITSDPISLLRVGTGGTVDPQGQFPKTVDQTRTSLFTQVASANVSFTQNNTEPSVTFLADIDQTTANGLLISEAGLFTASGAMFNIKTFPAIPKTNQFNIHFEWVIRLG